MRKIGHRLEDGGTVVRHEQVDSGGLEELNQRVTERAEEFVGSTCAQGALNGLEMRHGRRRSSEAVRSGVARGATSGAALHYVAAEPLDGIPEPARETIYTL